MGLRKKFEIARDSRQRMFEKARFDSSFCYKLLTIFAKNSIISVWQALIKPLMSVTWQLFFDEAFAMISDGMAKV